MGKISLELITDATNLLAGTDQGTESLKELAIQGKVTRESLKEDFAAAGKSTKEFNDAIKATVRELAEEGKAMEALILKYGNARQASIAVNRELATMQAQGKRNTEEFKQLSKISAELAHSVREVTNETRKLASETKTFDKIAEGARGMTAAFEVGAGVTALFGEKNEHLEKQILKVQGAMSLALGVQELAKIATEKGGIATGIATGLQQAYTFVVGESTGALKLFKLALAATGIGLAILLITELILHWDELTGSVKMSAEEHRKFIDSVIDGAEKATQAVDRELETVNKLSEAYTIRADAKRRELALLKAESADKAVINQKEREILEVQLGQARAIAANTKGAAENIKIWERGIEIREEEIRQGEKRLQNEHNLTDEAKERIQGDIDAAKAQITYLNTKLKVADEFKAAEKSILDVENQLKINQAQLLVIEFERQKLRDQRKDERINVELEKTTDAENRLRKELEQFLSNTLSNGQFKINDLPLETKIGLYRAMGLSAEQIAEQISKGIQDAPQKVPQNNAGFLSGLRDDAIKMAEEMKQKVGEAIQKMADNIRQTLGSVFQVLIQNQQDVIDSLDKKINKQEEVVKREEDLARKGAVNNVAFEVDKLNKLNEAREKALEKQKKIKNAQIAVDTVSQLSSLITAAAKVYESLANLPAVGVPLATALVATMFAAFAASKVAAAVLTSKQEGFREGGYTGDGDPSEVSTRLGNRGYKYHKREFVFDEDKTAKHREFFEALHNDNKLGIIYGMSDLLKDTGVSLPDPNLPESLSHTREELESNYRNQGNSELVKVREELSEIKEELMEWKSREGEEILSHNGQLIRKKGNRTVITGKAKK